MGDKDYISFKEGRNMVQKDYQLIQKKLGYIYSEKETTFRVWSPIKDKITLLLYKDSQTIQRKSYIMNKQEDGVHELVLKGNWKGYYYNYLVDDTLEVTDPYSIAASLNSNRSAIIDLKDTDPSGWRHHSIPKGNDGCDAIIYEVHIKDFTWHKTSGVNNRGKFLGMVEKNTKYQGISTGLSHLKELGVTHIHLLPIYDFLTVKEEKEFFDVDDNYNWGYDPELYNVVEGSYSTKPEDPINRIEELKRMIMQLHEEGFKVVLDVVYNHTYRGINSNFNIIMPDYYYRVDENGNFSDGSGCGNELATEKVMVKQFIIDSILYWIKEYKVDGFRFDLLALIDIDTVKEIVSKVKKVKPDILIYGEPWAAGSTILSPKKLTTKGTQKNLSFALFNDDFRNAVKGDNNGEGLGFSQGNLDCRFHTQTGVAGSISYDDSHKGFTAHPDETINYINSHDGLILYDKMKKVFPYMDVKGIETLNKLAFSILFTSQGIPFIHAGNEFLRTKNMRINTYNLPISINAIDWTYKKENYSFYMFFKDLIKLRKQYSVFRLSDEDSIKKRLKFLELPGCEAAIIYTLSLENKNGYLLIIHNANEHIIHITKAVLLEHLSKNYSDQKNDIQLKLIFDFNGFAKYYNTDEEHHLGIEIPNFTTNIYEIN
jgi:pullulanase